MPAYFVTLNDRGGRSLRRGADGMIVFASTGPIAVQMAQTYFDGDGASWSEAAATEIAVGASWEGWTFNVAIVGADGEPTLAVSYTGTAGNNTIDLIAAQLVILLNALSAIAAASYNSTSNTLTAAGAADNLGDRELKVEIIPPNGYAPVPQLVGAIVHLGVVAAALTVILPTDAAVIPKVLTPVKQV